MHGQNTVRLAKESAASVARKILHPNSGLISQARIRLKEPLVDENGAAQPLTRNQKLHAQVNLLSMGREARQLISIIRQSESESQIYQLAIRLQEIEGELRRGGISELANDSGQFDIQDFLQLSRVQRCDLITVKSFCDEFLRENSSLLIGGKDSPIRGVFISRSGVQGEKVGEIEENKSTISIWNIKEAKPGFPLVSVEYMQYTDALCLTSFSLGVSLSGKQTRYHPLVHLQNLLEMEGFDSGAVIYGAENEIAKANGISKGSADWVFSRAECEFFLRSPSKEEAPSHENGWREIIFEATATVFLNGKEIAWLSLKIPDASLSFEFMDKNQRIRWKDTATYFARVYA